jgi:hypothetical protein
MKRTLLFLAILGLIAYLTNPKPLGQVLNSSFEKVKKGFKNEAKEQSQSILTNSLTSANHYVREKSQEILGEEIELPIEVSKPKAEIVSDVPNKQLDNIILVDYLTSKDLKLSLKLNKQYYLDLRNVPPEYCLFVNQTSYSVPKNEYLSIKFSNPGHYDLFFDRCTHKPEKFAEIVVE